MDSQFKTLCRDSVIEPICLPPQDVPKSSMYSDIDVKDIDCYKPTVQYPFPHFTLEGKSTIGGRVCHPKLGKITHITTFKQPKFYPYSSKDEICTTNTTNGIGNATLGTHCKGQCKIGTFPEQSKEVHYYINILQSTF